MLMHDIGCLKNCSKSSLEQIKWAQNVEVRDKTVEVLHQILCIRFYNAYIAFIFGY